MKALTFDPRNDQFQVREVPLPEPGSRDVLIKVDACGLNPVDAKITRWKAAVPGMDEFWVPGLDVSGHITTLGSEVRGWSVGERVLCHGNMFRPHGGFAEYTIQAADAIIRHPHVGAALAAATPCAGWTAWRALHERLHAGQRDSILITGGSGAVGSIAVQIARHLGLKTIIATCSAANLDYVKSLGATHVLDYRDGNLLKNILEITEQRGVTLGLDTVGLGNDVLVANALAYEGQMLELVDTVRPINYRDAFGRGLAFHQLSLGSAHRHGSAALSALTAAGMAFSELLERGDIEVPRLRTISLDEVGAAVPALLAPHPAGKLVLVFQ